MVSLGWIPRLRIASAKCWPDAGSMCGYGDVVSLIRSRSKKSDPGIWRARKDERPVRCWGSLGRNHAALSGSIRDWGSDFVELDVADKRFPRAL